MSRYIKKSMLCFLMACGGFSGFADVYPAAGSSTEPNVWTRNYSGVLVASKGTGYPILLLIVTDGCSHCHAMMTQSINTPEFEAMDTELKFYKVIVNGASDYKVLAKYENYFNNNMYPLAAVLRMDGSVYGSFGNRATDNRNIAPELQTLIKNLTAEQTGDGSVVAPSQPSVSTVELGAKLKGKVNGILFDGNQEIVGMFVLSISAKGKASAKFTMMSGRVTIKGALSAQDNVPQFAAESLSLAYDSEKQVWSGRFGDYIAYASALSSSAFSGLYTSPATNAANSGYATVTVKNGKGKFAGMVGGKNKVSANGAAVVLPGAIVKESLPKWDSGFDAAAFVPIVKRGKCSGGAAVGDGKVRISFSMSDGVWGGDGAIWPTSPDLGMFGGKVLRLTTGTGVLEVSILAVNGRKVELSANDMSAKVSFAEKKGTFRGKVNISGAKYSFDGALIKTGEGVFGKGVSYGAGVYPVEIAD